MEMEREEIASALEYCLYLLDKHGISPDNADFNFIKAKFRYIRSMERQRAAATTGE